MKLHVKRSSPIKIIMNVSESTMDHVTIKRPPDPKLWNSIAKLVYLCIELYR